MKKEKYVDLNEREKLRLVAKDILLMKMTAEDTLQQIMDKFYKIMRKHKIKQTTSDDGGKTFQGNAFEWTICKTLLLSALESNMNISEWGVYGFKSVPKDLER